MWCLYVKLLAVFLPFCIIAGFMAGAIIYEEYSHHFKDKDRVLKPAIEMGITVFFFFLLLASGIFIFIFKFFK